MNGYFNSPSQVLVSSHFGPDDVDLQEAIIGFQHLIKLDREYCSMVEGACQEPNLWVPRNETLLCDADLHRFKSIAWNNCVVKKFLDGREGSSSEIGKSMLDIVRKLNLEWNQLHVMGLHPRVESAEKQIIMYCMEQGLLGFTLEVGNYCRAFRRCKNFRDFFANAVGGQVVANAGRTPGLVKTQYGTDMDYAYKNKSLYYFVWALKQHRDDLDALLDSVDETDYVEELEKIRVVSRKDVDTQLGKEVAKPPNDRTAFALYLEEIRRAQAEGGAQLQSFMLNLKTQLQELLSLSEGSELPGQDDLHVHPDELPKFVSRIVKDNGIRVDSSGIRVDSTAKRRRPVISDF